MNLQEQLGALETGVNQLIQAVTASVAASREAEGDATTRRHVDGEEPKAVVAEAAAEEAVQTAPEAPAEPQHVADEKPTLHIERPLSLIHI